jgi:ABC-2 type transport system ATP-binding protein
MPLIAVHNASKTFDRVTALDQVSFTVEKGEVVGLLGPNGSGKTTVIRLLSAYFPPTQGQVIVDGFNTRAAPLEVRRRMGYALEGVILYPDLTVSDFLDFVGAVKKVNRQHTAEVVAQCGLNGWLQRRIGTLSKGYRQRVMLAQALMGDPPILILDEPTSGMDPEMAVQVRQLMKTFTGARTIVLSTHSMAEANLVCTRVIVLHQGRVLAQGTPRDVFSLQTPTATFEDEFIRLLHGATGDSR